MKKIFILFLICFYYSIYSAIACTNFIVTKGASTDGSVMVTYAADSHSLYGELYYRGTKTYPKGSMMKIYEWDSGKYLGEIEQAEYTYNVVGNVNEFQVAIGETTYGGRDELIDSTGLLDYGNLIYIALQRSKTAREAIKVITELIDKYGYCSSGESFSVCDKNEAWIFEMIGKGAGRKGAVWVALLIPDGYVCAHANQARITNFEYQKKNDWFNPKQTTFNSKDVISFAREKKYFDGKDTEFSFSDTYAPVDFGAARFCEMRVWAFYNDVKKGMEQYWDYAKGNLIKSKWDYTTNRMPLWIKPDNKVSLKDLMRNMGNHLEGTELDMTKGIGAGPFHCPYRWRPMTWSYNGVDYIHERATGTQQTGFSFVAQLRSELPDVIGAINWFGVDDCAMTVYVPMFASITKIPKPFEVGNGSLTHFTTDAAFWIFNLVSNFAYTRYSDIYPEIQQRQNKLHDNFIDEISKLDKKLLELNKTNPNAIVNELNNYSYNASMQTMNEWNNLFAYLFTKYLDGNVKSEAKVPSNYLYHAPKVEHPKYQNDWYRRIVEDGGDKVKVIK